MTSDSPVICSRAGCQAPATVVLVWRNSKIHGEDRRKKWLACDEHRAFLIDYLSTRGFYIGLEKLA